MSKASLPLLQSEAETIADEFLVNRPVCYVSRVAV
nr:MAG TPA: hypothetical protein [Caudoviricetes sp.]